MLHLLVEITQSFTTFVIFKIQKMKIIIVDRGNPIPVKNYGGTERVIEGLGYELAKMGHEIVFVVPEGSECSFGQIIEYKPEIPLNKLLPKDADIVHLNFIPPAEPDIPYLVTMHANPDRNWKLLENTVFISKNQAQRYHSDTFVYNGLLWDDYPEVDLSLSRDYLHFLGKASWRVKNMSGAAEIAVKSNNRLKVLGGNRWKFCNFKRKPFYSLHPKISYCGVVDNVQKITIMQKSKGLVFPVLWDEPFGLAIIESLYAGCPVFGTKRGSLPELINDSVGFVSNEIDEIVEAITEKAFNPEVCHNYAVANFNSKIMTDNYLKLYEKVLKGESLNKELP
jgi:glycosyltransferase involved in cell wall biosynthesis